MNKSATASLPASDQPVVRFGGDLRLRIESHKFGPCRNRDITVPGAAMLEAAGIRRRLSIPGAVYDDEIGSHGQVS